MNQLKQIHAYTLRNGTDFSRFLIVKLLEIPNIPYAHALFDLIPSPAFYLYNKLIKAYSSHGPYHHCLSLFNQMCLQGFSPNQHTFTYLFSACASLSSPRNAQMLHTHFIKSFFQFDMYALTTLVDMYAKLGLLAWARQQFNEMRRRDVPTWNSMIAGHARCGDMEGALELFGLMPRRNVISWTTMISGYSQNGQYGKALEMFMVMEKQKGVKPNQVTIASVLPACANTGALEVGQRIEWYARVNGYFKDMIVCNAILEMYSRCGLIDMAKRVFDEIGSRRDVWSWNSMIMGLAIHGKCNEALQLFHEMLREGMAPDDVTFVGVLLACTHGGKVEEGRKLFESMEHKFSITAKKEHYGCMVDLLGRAGELHDAYELIQSMPMKPDAVVWGAMLGACSFSGNVELAERAAEYLFELEPWNPGNYVILSNIYAKAGQWDGVARLRMLMKGCQITKAAGYSFIEEGGQIHKFIVEDRSHPRSHEIYALLDEISIRLKLHGNPSHLDYAVEQLCIVN
ncbi:pentatricopeptide repeat-containing protein At5g08510 [Cornus florida]|uniref:pentatricopeptide repeat-containing protein At5g08510 n=1 Tax=Cornus florida TaxID=4283 RepID=UPI00289C9EAC|nr:pentatricopeptide repeat-containing protein At5g08510 [Cornus florida]